MRFRAATLIVVLAFLAGSIRTETLPFERFTVDDGLPQSTIFSLLQDRDGYLWLGTQNGLSRYSGLEFQNFNRRDVSEGRIFCLLQDRRGRIWAGSQTDGLFGWDGRRWSRFTTRDGLPAYAVLTLGEDAEGTLWVGTSRGWARFDGRRATPLREGPGGSNSPAPGRAFWRDADGTLWLGTLGAGLWRKDASSWRSLTRADGLPSDRITGVLRDRRGRLWVTTQDAGVAYQEGSDWKRFGLRDGLPAESILCLLEDRGGHLWVGTGGGGAARFDGRQWWTVSQRQGLSANEVRSLLQDREGNLWFGTASGASKLSSLRFRSYTTADGLPDDFVWAVAEDGAGRLWAGTNSGGLARFDGRRWTPAADAPLPARTVVRSLFRDRQGRLWAGTATGALCLSGTRWERFPFQLNGVTSTVYTIDQDRSGALWFGTQQGVIRMTGRDWRVFTTADGLVDNYIFSIFEDRAGRLWFGNRQGVSRFDGRNWRSWTSREGLPATQVMDVAEDRQGRIWLATFGGGLARLDGDTPAVLSTADGMSNAYCYFILPQGDDLYVGTNRGLNRYDGRRFHVYTARDGLASSELNQGAVYRDREGCLWFGTVAGLTRFDPRLDAPDHPPPPVHLTGLRLFDKPVPARDGLSLAHKQNFLRFEYHGVSLSDPRTVRYRFRLAGLNPEWAETAQRSIPFPYLPPGEYTFEVAARVRDGAWSPAPARLRFTIRPPFWETWWFRVLAAAGLLAILYTIRRLEIRSMRTRSLHLKRMVRARTLELEEKTRLLEDSNVRLQELDRLKSNFLATVSHELRTPLTSIRAFAEILMDNRAESEETQLRYLGIINEESERLTRLIEDLLDLSRIESGRARWDLRPLDLAEVLSTSVESAEPLVRTQGLELHTGIPADLPRVTGDFDRLVQVMTNLLGNAVKFTPAGGSLRLEARTEGTDGGRRVRVTLADSGSGIPSDQLERIFEKFHQVDSSAARTSGGTGLGLTICREIVRHHGGEIWAESPPGGGSVFHFTLPVAPGTPRGEPT